MNRTTGARLLPDQLYPAILGSSFLRTVIGNGTTQPVTHRRQSDLADSHFIHQPSLDRFGSLARKLQVELGASNVIRVTLYNELQLGIFLQHLGDLI
jgi:hypothetical protein